MNYNTLIAKARFKKGLRSNLFHWRDVSGHEVDIVADYGSSAIGMELKAGMTVIPDFFKGITFWQKLTSYEKNYLIYGGDETQKRSTGIEVIPWNQIRNL